MKQTLFAIVDEKAQSITPPFMSENEATARRVISVSLPAESLPRRWPADFALVRLGDIDTRDGAIEALTAPLLVCKLDEIFEVK